MIILDSDDQVCGRVVNGATRIKTTTPKGRKLDTVTCERIARLRAQALLDARDFDGALPWLRHANEHMVRNNVMRLRTVRR